MDHRTTENLPAAPDQRSRIRGMWDGTLSRSKRHSSRSLGGLPGFRSIGTAAAAFWAPAIALFFLGCPPPPELRSALDLKREHLPETLPELIALADATHASTRSVASSAHAAAGLERALAQKPSDYEVIWRLARVYVTIADGLADKEMRIKFAKAGKRFAKQALTLNEKRPEGYYYGAAAAGLIAESQLAPGRSYQEAVERPASQLVELAPEYEAGGGLRILGALYSKAPTWPVGVGDLDEGISLLERAVLDFPGHPLNHLFLAEAYAKVNRREDAIKRLQTVLQFPPEGEWALIGRKYRTLARQMLDDLSINP